MSGPLEKRELVVLAPRLSEPYEPLWNTGANVYDAQLLPDKGVVYAPAEQEVCDVELAGQ